MHVADSKDRTPDWQPARRGLPVGGLGGDARHWLSSEKQGRQFSAGRGALKRHRQSAGRPQCSSPV